MFGTLRAWWCHFSEAAKYISLHPESHGMPWWFDLPPELRDAAAIRSDWQVVGNDMRKAMSEHGKSSAKGSEPSQAQGMDSGAKMVG